MDGFAPDPDALRAAACAATFEPARHHYPGVRAPLPDEYLAGRMPLIAGVVAEIFGRQGAIDLVDASFAMVTTPPAELTVRQRLPHCDAFAPDRIALIHCLSPGRSDGTAFFRHRSTGFETVDAERAPVFLGQLDAELRHGGLPDARYIDGDTPLFERTERAEAEFNRALLYRSYLLHSGALSPDAVLSADPAAGRLTITAFFSVGA